MTVFAYERCVDGRDVTGVLVIDRVWFGSPSGPTVDRKFILSTDRKFVMINVGEGLAPFQVEAFNRLTEDGHLLTTNEMPLIPGQDVYLMDHWGGFYKLCFLVSAENTRTYWMPIHANLFVDGIYHDTVFYHIWDRGVRSDLAVGAVHQFWGIDAPVDRFVASAAIEEIEHYSMYDFRQEKGI